MTETPNPEKQLLVKTVKPFNFNFLINAELPTTCKTLSHFDDSNYKSFNSERLEIKNHNCFRPTIQSKRLFEEPKFLLSLERKKIKIMNGINQRTTSQKPTRNSYRSQKVKISNKSQITEERDQKIKAVKMQEEYQREMENEKKFKISPRKAKQPYLHFNLQHIINKRKTFDFSAIHEAEIISGSNLPYDTFFSSEKSTVPASQRSHRSKNRRYVISTTTGVRQKDQLIFG